MVNRRLLGMLLGALLFGLVCSLASTARAAPKSASKAIGFSNLVFRLTGRDEVGIADQDFRVHVLEYLRKRGVNAVGAENLVFGSDRGSSADLMLGGTVMELECLNASYGNLSCRIGIEWQVLDVARDAVIYKVITRGRVLDSPKEPTATLGKRLVVATLDSLTQRGAFKGLFDADPQGKPGQGYAHATLRACKPPQRAMPAASEQVLDSTVLVQTSSGFGSGFLLSADGYVVTAAHVVPEASATIKLRDGREFSGTVIRIDRRIDIALLRLALPEGTSLSCLAVRTAPVAVGADVYAVGAPASRDLSFSLARGIVSGVRLLNELQYLQTDAAINSGNSGGPLVTADGEAAAIVSFKLVGHAVEGLAFGVPLGAGLKALGVATAEGFTSPELASAGAAKPRAARKLFVDYEDAVPELDGSAKPHDTSVKGVGRRKTSPLAKGVLFALGGTTLVTGVALISTSLLVASSESGRDASKGMGSLGLGMTAVGGVLVGVGFALP
jgi:S1-C subfamily serine protease